MKNRNYLILITLLLPLLCSGCKSTQMANPVQYEYLMVERQGGGQLDFRVYPGESRSHLNIYVSSSNFQPVEKRFQLHIDESNMDAIDDFYKALNGQMSLKGTVKPSAGLTGTWLNIRFVLGNRTSEVTNPELLQRFAVFEKMVREVIDTK